MILVAKKTISHADANTDVSGVLQAKIRSVLPVYGMGGAACSTISCTIQCKQAQRFIW